MKRGFYIRAVVLGFAFLCAFLVKAQEPPKTDPEQPLPAMGADGATSRSGEERPYSEPEPDVTPETRPITGFQNLSLGMKAADRNTLLPSFTAATSIQSSPYNSSVTNSSGLESSTTLAGRLALNHISQVSALLLDYVAGATFSSDPNQGNSGLQSLDFSESLQRGRWSLMAGDQLFYSSSSPFGFGGIGGVNNYGVGLNEGNGSGLRSGVAPDQSVLTTGDARISNAVVFQTSYALSHRASFTTGVSYGILKFLGNGLQSNSNVTVEAGYGYSVTRHDSIAVSYGYSRFMFSGNTIPASQGHSVQFSYARQITGRLSFRIGAGPTLQLYTAPLSGPDKVVSWAMSTTLNYKLGYLSTAVNYSHGQTGGSGIFPGSETDSLTADVNRAISRDWSGALSAGYARNRAFQQTSTAANLNSPEAFYFAARANRRVFQRGSLFVAYALSKQLNLAAVCSLPSCQVGALSHTGTIGYSWAMRPIVLE